jgi:hypothetical protein
MLAYMVLQPAIKFDLEYRRTAAHFSGELDREAGRGTMHLDPYYGSLLDPGGEPGAQGPARRDAPLWTTEEVGRNS